MTAVTKTGLRSNTARLALRPEILLLGARGQVGWELQRALALCGRVVLIRRAQCDLSDAAALAALLNQSAAAVIVNAAAYTAVDRAQTDVAAAYAVNARLPEALADHARRRGAWLLHFSTDQVFDGAKNTAYFEVDPPQPANVYGASKLAGEQAVLAAAPDAAVLRLSWVFGLHGNNFVRMVLQQARNDAALRVVMDQRGCPTPAALVADVAALAVRAYLRGQQPLRGIYHLAGRGPISRHAYAQQIIALAWRLGLPGLRLRPAQVQAITSQDFASAAQRPANAVLACGRLEAALQIMLPDWQPYLNQMLEEMA